MALSALVDCIEGALCLILVVCNNFWGLYVKKGTNLPSKDKAELCMTLQIFCLNKYLDKYFGKNGTILVPALMVVRNHLPYKSVGLIYNLM